MGLSPAVLRQLLVTESNADAGPSRSSTSGGEAGEADHSESEHFQFEFDVDERTSPKEVLLDPVYDEDAVEDEDLSHPHPHHPNHPHRFRVRMLSEPESTREPVVGSPAPLSVSEMLWSRGDDRPASVARTASPARIGSPTGTVGTNGSGRGRVVTVADGVTAQYVFTGE